MTTERNKSFNNPIVRTDTENYPIKGDNNIILQESSATLKAEDNNSSVKSADKFSKKTFHFKTNINCGGCISKVAPSLNKAKGIYSWDVDTTKRDKILTIHSAGISESEIIERIRTIGFDIETLNP